MPDPGKYYGKYRGTVLTTLDPLQIGRLQAQVPDVYGDTPSTWAMPSFPVAGTGMGHFALPAVGAGVWVEFEQGDLNYPIWTGCWYGSSSELPTAAKTGLPASPNMVLQTIGQHTVILSDTPGGEGITLKTATGASLVINDLGITISTGQGATIALTGSTVTINQGALVVT